MDVLQGKQGYFTGKRNQKIQDMGKKQITLNESQEQELYLMLPRRRMYNLEFSVIEWA